MSLKKNVNPKRFPFQKSEHDSKAGVRIKFHTFLLQ